jgi:hypothetical protein
MILAIDRRAAAEQSHREQRPSGKSGKNMDLADWFIVISERPWSATYLWLKCERP